MGQMYFPDEKPKIDEQESKWFYGCAIFVGALAGFLISCLIGYFLL